MGDISAALVLIGVGIVIFLLVMFGFIDIPFLNQRKPNQWSVDISAASSGGAISNFQALAAVNPRGTIFVDANKPLQVNASDFEGWTFSSWLFDDADFGDTPYVVVPAQASNSSHTLVAVFELKLPAFEISPNLVAVKGTTVIMRLNLKNNENADISQISLKLNDPFGIFDGADLVDEIRHGSSIGGNQWTAYYSGSALNAFCPVVFTDESHTLLRQSSQIFMIGTTGYGTGFRISSTVAAGTYHLSWSIQFTVSGGTFSEPPDLTIPWDVTILG